MKSGILFNARLIDEFEPPLCIMATELYDRGLDSDDSDVSQSL